MNKVCGEKCGQKLQNLTIIYELATKEEFEEEKMVLYL